MKDVAGGNRLARLAGGSGLALGLVACLAGGCVVDSPHYTSIDAANGGGDAPVDGPPAAGWSMAVSSNQYDFGRAVAYDQAGNVYVVGSFWGNAVLAGDNVTSNGQTDVFVAKFAADGTKQWARTYGGTGLDDAFDIKVGAAGVVVCGSFTNSVDFGTGLITAETTDGFVLALDTDGATSWVDHRGGPGSTVFRRLAVDGTQVIAGGDFTSSLALPSGSVTAHGTVDLLAISYTPSGAITWGQVVGGTDFDDLGGVALTGDGDALVAGTFRGTLDVGVGPALTSAGSGDIFVAKLAAATGGPVWARRFGSAGLEATRAVAWSSGALWIAGCFSGTTSIGGTSLASEGAEDVFVATLDQSGGGHWAKSYGAAGSDCATDVVASNASAIVLGTFEDTILVEGASLQSSGAADLFLVELTNDGAGTSAKRGGGGGTDGSGGLAVRAGWVAVAGNTRGAPDMFGIPLPPLNLFLDGFAVQLSR